MKKAGISVDVDEARRQAPGWRVRATPSAPQARMTFVPGFQLGVAPLLILGLWEPEAPEGVGSVKHCTRHTPSQRTRRQQGTRPANSGRRGTCIHQPHRTRFPTPSAPATPTTTALTDLHQPQHCTPLGGKRDRHVHRSYRATILGRLCFFFWDLGLLASHAWGAGA